MEVPTSSEWVASAGFYALGQGFPQRPTGSNTSSLNRLTPPLPSAYSRLISCGPIVEAPIPSVRAETTSPSLLNDAHSARDEWTACHGIMVCVAATRSSARLAHRASELLVA